MFGLVISPLTVMTKYNLKTITMCVQIYPVLADSVLIGHSIEVISCYIKSESADGVLNETIMTKHPTNDYNGSIIYL